MGGVHGTRAMTVELLPITRFSREVSDILYDLLAERPKHAQISHRKMPTKQEHDRFVRTWRRRYRAFYFIGVPFIDGSCHIRVGAIYLTHLNEIGIAIFAEYQGCGYGSSAVKTLIKKHNPLPAIPGQRVAKFIANVNPMNMASIGMFRKLGFKDHMVTLMKGVRNGQA